MWEKIRVVFTIPELRQKILLTLFFLAIYRIGWQIPLPVVDQSKMTAYFKSDAGGRCAVMLGVPFHWRKLHRDSVGDKALHTILTEADILSPWSVGRFRTPKEVAATVQQHWREDKAWCRKASLGYLPVVLPGFSWHNLRAGKAKLDQIPRRGGKFLWQQFVSAKSAGAEMVYIAMFDEVDEGTAIFKCTNDPPVGASPFLDYEGLPTDHYLWLAGEGARLLRGKPGLSVEFPKRRD